MYHNGTHYAINEDGCIMHAHWISCDKNITISL